MGAVVQVGGEPVDRISGGVRTAGGCADADDGAPGVGHAAQEADRAVGAQEAAQSFLPGRIPDVGGVRVHYHDQLHGR